MGFFSDIASGIASFASSIVSGISDICSSIGGSLFSGIGGIATIASALIPGVGLPEIILVVDLVCKVVSTIVEALGLGEKEETAEELGMAAEQADLKPEDFDTTEAYIEYLREEMKKIDKEEVENLSDIDKVKYQAIGTAIRIKGIEEKMEVSAPTDFWLGTAKLGLSGEEVKTYLDTFKENDLTNMKDMTDYLQGKNTETNVHKVSDSIMETLGKIYPEMTEKELEDKLCEMEKKISETNE